MSRRQKARDLRRRQFWADKESAARTPAAEAALAWDQLRAAITKLDGAAAGRAWQGVTITLRQVASELCTTSRAPDGANAQPRAGAREATSRRVQ